MQTTLIYTRNRFSKKKEPELYFMKAAEAREGLTMIMDSMLDDFFFFILPITGWKIIEEFIREMILVNFYLSLEE